MYCIAVTLGGQVHQDRYMTDVWLCNCDTYMTICDSVSVFLKSQVWDCIPVTSMGQVYRSIACVVGV